MINLVSATETEISPRYLAAEGPGSNDHMPRSMYICQKASEKLGTSSSGSQVPGSGGSSTWLWQGKRSKCSSVSPV